MRCSISIDPLSIWSQHSDFDDQVSEKSRGGSAITVFCPGFQKGRVPSEKGTLARWTDRQKGTLARWTEEKGHN